VPLLYQRSKMPRKPDWFFLAIMFALVWLFGVSLVRAVLDEDWWALITLGPLIIVGIMFAVSIIRLMRKLRDIEKGYVVGTAQHDAAEGEQVEVDLYQPTQPL